MQSRDRFGTRLSLGLLLSVLSTLACGPTVDADAHSDDEDGGEQSALPDYGSALEVLRVFRDGGTVAGEFGQKWLEVTIGAPDTKSIEVYDLSGEAVRIRREDRAMTIDEWEDADLDGRTDYERHSVSTDAGFEETVLEDQDLDGMFETRTRTTPDAPGFLRIVREARVVGDGGTDEFRIISDDVQPVAQAAGEACGGSFAVPTGSSTSLTGIPNVLIINGNGTSTCSGAETNQILRDLAALLDGGLACLKATNPRMHLRLVGALATKTVEIGCGPMPNAAGCAEIGGRRVLIDFGKNRHPCGEIVVLHELLHVAGYQHGPMTRCAEYCSKSCGACAGPAPTAATACAECAEARPEKVACGSMIAAAPDSQCGIDTGGPGGFACGDENYGYAEATVCTKIWATACDGKTRLSDRPEGACADVCPEGLIATEYPACSAEFFEPFSLYQGCTLPPPFCQ